MGTGSIFSLEFVISLCVTIVLRPNLRAVEYIHQAVNLITFPTLDIHKLLVIAGQQDQRRLQLVHRRFHCEDLEDGMVLNTGKHPDYVVVGRNRHGYTLATMDIPMLSGFFAHVGEK